MRQLRQLPGLLALMLLALLFTVACGGAEPVEEAAEEVVEATTEEAAEVQEAAVTLEARAILADADGNELGTVHFLQEGQTVRIMGDLENAGQEGPHGFHIHEGTECTPPDFASAGGHFNPTDVPHACPPTTPRHAGDLGNIMVGPDGAVTLDVNSDLISLAPSADNAVVGRAVILHAGEDDCESQPSGDAGARLACGLIEGVMPVGEAGMHTGENGDHGHGENGDHGHDEGEDHGYDGDGE